MHRRYLQADGRSVLWHDRDGRRATLFNFETRELRLTGRVRDLTAGEDVADTNPARLEAGHTYVITEAQLPTHLLHNLSLG